MRRYSGCLPILTLLVTAPATAAERGDASYSGLPANPALSYARTCDAYGSGYFAVPGSDLCLQPLGFALGEFDLRQTPMRGFAPNPGTASGKALTGSQASVGGGGALGLAIDARLAAERGPVTAFVSAYTAFGAGLVAPNPAAVYSQGANVAGAQALHDRAQLDLAYVRYAGWTAGRAQSIFDFYADAWNITPLRGSDARTEQLAYRFRAGPSVEAALALENNVERRNLVGQAINAAASANYTGLAAPDPVAALRVETPFGLAQVSGAAHELRTRYAAPASVAPGQPDSTTTSQWGFAAQGGLKVNLPNLSDADAMILQATYARGASAYLTGDAQPIFGGVNDLQHPGIANPRLAAAPGLSSYDYDCVSSAQSFVRCDKSSGYAIVAAIKHFWTPTVSSSLFTSFFGMNYSDSARAGAGGVNGATNYQETAAGANLTWTPLKNLMVGGEVAYTRGKATGAPAAAPPGAAASWAGAEWSGRVRVQHNF